MRQSLQEIEILVADDCSTDDSAAVAERLAAEDPRIRVLRQSPNGGKPRAMNVMMEAARGEWVAVLDADDAYHPQRLERLVRAAEAAGVDMAADNLFYVDAGVDRALRTGFDPADGQRIIGTRELIGTTSTFASFDYGVLKPVVRRAFMQQHVLAYYEHTRLAEDFYYLLNFFVAGGRCCLLSEALYYWTMPFGTVSRQWTGTGSGPWRYDYRPALKANQHFIDEMRMRQETEVVAMLESRGRQYRAMIHYLDAQRAAADAAPTAMRRHHRRPPLDMAPAGRPRCRTAGATGRRRAGRGPGGGAIGQRRPGVAVVNAVSPAFGRAGGPRVLIISASDTKFCGLLRSMVASIQPVLDAPNVDFACLDIGLGQADLAWLESFGAKVVKPRAHLGVDPAAHSPALLSFLARPFLPEYFPGYDVYTWIDSDIWLQDPEVVTAYVEGARTSGLAITHERERGYRFQGWLFAWTTKHFLLGYGPLTTAWLLARRHVNAGFFAMSANTPHWEGWARRYAAAIKRTGAVVPHDQFALNHSLHASEGRRTGARLLDPTCNWIVDRSVPMWDDAAGVYCKPYAPYERIGALHLAGPAKRKLFEVRRTGGGTFSTYLVRGTSPASPALSLDLSAGAAVPAAAG